METLVEENLPARRRQTLLSDYLQFQSQKNMMNTSNLQQTFTKLIRFCHCE